MVLILILIQLLILILIQVLILKLQSCLMQGKANLDSLTISKEERARLKAQLLRKVASRQLNPVLQSLPLTKLFVAVLVLRPSGALFSLLLFSRSAACFPLCSRSL